MENRIRLNSKEILEKDFKIGFRGYDQDEVDQFLDTVIKDYQTFQREIDRLTQENEKLKRNSNRTTTEASNTKPQPNGTGITNYDILKRLSNLEKHVFGSKLYD